DHRERRDAGPGARDQGAGPAQGPRHRHRDRRLRHRLLEPRLPEALPDRPPQARPVLRHRTAQRLRRRLDRARCDRHGAQPRPQGHRRGCRDRGAARVPRQQRLQPDAGLPVLAAGPRSPMREFSWRRRRDRFGRTEGGVVRGTRLMSTLRRRPVQLALSVLASVALGALLAATIYWTRFDPRWGVFLAGVLFTAVLATASNASKAEWVVVRRTRQLDRLRVKLADADARSTSATDAFRAMEARVRALADALTQPVLLFDRDEICRFHNAVAAREARMAGRDLVGKPLREIFGDAAYEAMQPHLHASFAGAPLRYALSWQGVAYQARQLMHAATGLWLVLEPAATIPVEVPPRTSPEIEVIDEHGDAVYLRAIARELTGWEDPRAKITRALAEDRFLFFAQKIRPLEIGRPDPLCYEILLRMQEEEENLLPPGGFLPEAERFGMMEAIDRWVVRNLVTACLERRRREPAWQAPLYFVNLSASALREPAFGRYVQK